MKQKTSTDDVLLADARNGDTSAFKQLVERYEHQVAATVIGMLGQGPDAEEVGQDVFIRFYRSLNQYKGDAALGTYLTRIAINLSLNRIKKRKRMQKFGFWNGVDKESMPDVSDEEASRNSQDVKEWVQLALNYLSPEYRSVIVLRLIDGYSTQETAQILGVPSGTVLSRLARGQKKMREIIKSMES